jgi:hypothetical protein
MSMEPEHLATWAAQLSNADTSAAAQRLFEALPREKRHHLLASPAMQPLILAGLGSAELRPFALAQLLDLESSDGGRSYLLSSALPQHLLRLLCTVPGPPLSLMSLLSLLLPRAPELLQSPGWASLLQSGPEGRLRAAELQLRAHLLPADSLLREPLLAADGRKIEDFAFLKLLDVLPRSAPFSSLVNSLLPALAERLPSLPANMEGLHWASAVVAAFENHSSALGAEAVASAWRVFVTLAGFDAASSQLPDCLICSSAALATASGSHLPDSLLRLWTAALQARKVSAFRAFSFTAVAPVPLCVNQLVRELGGSSIATVIPQLLLKQSPPWSSEARSAAYLALRDLLSQEVFLRPFLESPLSIQWLLTRDEAFKTCKLAKFTVVEVVSHHPWTQANLQPEDMSRISRHLNEGALYLEREVHVAALRM